jgi:putative endonuclease
MFSVYVIQSSCGKIYTGHTSDLERRLLEHNAGLCKTTKSSGNWQVIYAEEFVTRGEATKRERWMKTGVGREFIDEVTRGGVRRRRSSSSGS